MAVPESERASKQGKLGTKGSWAVVQARNTTMANRHWGATMKTIIEAPGFRRIECHCKREVPTKGRIVT